MSNRFDILLPEEVPERENWRWATVAVASPLNVRFDGEASPAPIVADSLIYGLEVGDRVWCQVHGRRVIVQGRSGGTPPVSGVPAGTIHAFGGITAPSGFLMCTGGAVSRTTYADLFAVIGTRFGAGDGSTTFNLPNATNKFLRGMATGSIGTTGGADTHTLTASEMPVHTHAWSGTTSSDSHTHTFSATTGDDTHTHTWSGTTSSDSHYHDIPDRAVVGSGTGAVVESWGGGTGGRTVNTSTDAHTHTVSGTTGGDTHNHTVSGTTGSDAHTHTVSGTTVSAGSGTAHNNMPAYLAVAYIIKT